VLVFEISSYSGSRSKPPKRVKSSDLPPRKSIDRLIKLLEVDDMPCWYPYNDGSQIAIEEYASLRRNEDEEDHSSDDNSFSSDEEWDSDADETVAGFSDNDEDENDCSDHTNDLCGEVEVPGAHEDAAGNELMTAGLPATFSEYIRESATLHDC